MKIKKLLHFIVIASGAFLIAFSVTCFLVPFRITTGGVSAIGTVFLYAFGVPISITNLVVNVVLFVVGYKLLGKKMLLRTAFGVVTLTLFFEVCTHLPVYREDILSGAVAGGLILGVGLGLVIKFEGSTGGSDFLSIMIHYKRPHLSVSALILIVDFLIIAVSGVVFSSVTVIMYSLISLFIATKVCDFFLGFGRSAKKIEILSHKSEYIANAILTHFNRGLTGISCRGMYTGENRLMLMCIVSPRDLPRITDFVRNCDERAFVCVSDVREVLGEGFRSLR